MNKTKIHRMINADTLLDDFRGSVCNDCSNARFIEMLIDDAPTIDVVPVRRGEWIPGVNNSQKCSKCFTNKHYGVKGNFCPNCGADMRERSDVE